MKKVVEREVTVCDSCGQECYDACVKCGKHWCYDCKKKGMAVEYAHSVYFSGSGDGVYCAQCDRDAFMDNSDVKHAAYIAIQRLRDEGRRWNADFTSRCNAAEARLKKILESEDVA